MNLDEWGERYRAAMVEQLVLNGWTDDDAREAAEDNWTAIDKRDPAAFRFSCDPERAAVDELSYWSDDGE